MSKIICDNAVNQLQKLDWELSDADTRYSTHKFHPYSAKYIPQIPQYIIKYLSKKNDTVLDMFLGSGTTIVEANCMMRNCIGVDINPLACKISSAKTTIMTKSDIIKIQQILDQISTHIKKSNGFDHDKYIEKYVDVRVHNWFQENILKELVIMKKIIDGIENLKIRNFMFVGFSAILRSVSDTASGFGNLMISKNPPKKKNAFKRYISSISTMIDGMEYYRNNCTSNKIQIYNKTAKDLSFLKPKSVDLICTHPPYMASVPYAEYQKLSMWWMGLNNNEVDKTLIGGQRSRDGMAEQFMEDMQKVIDQMYYVLKNKKYCAIVIGNPVYNGKVWELDKILTKMGKLSGFDFLTSIKRGKYKETVEKMKNEYTLIFKKC